MYYAYILLSSKSHVFYYGSTSDLKSRFKQHNTGKSFATKPHIPWGLVWYAGFQTKREAEDFELYLKRSWQSFCLQKIDFCSFGERHPKATRKKCSEAIRR